MRLCIWLHFITDSVYYNLNCDCSLHIVFGMGFNFTFQVPTKNEGTTNAIIEIETIDLIGKTLNLIIDPVSSVK